MRALEIRTALVRGWRKRCPRCGRGAMYSRWISTIDRCSDCGFVFDRNDGAMWFFINLADRIVLLVLIGAIYFGVHRSHPRAAVILFALVGSAFAWTTPNRWGACTALDYLSGVAFDTPGEGTTRSDPAAAGLGGDCHISGVAPPLFETQRPAGRDERQETEGHAQG